ncbi:threonine/serine exporter family protein [Actinocorallia sp. A-T 12471]|uniref:threonine/serine ThrE exporter family protein n=1 Tax=Actinocorallia sp. A-T 12471 TaxID=3089813 RepID=UPI0029D3B6A4|nr:threonine/serine exporter family protein [Actinocorallia sp. A-T 12471]MDX6739274.1 threonine/serine exporter family protein [Actinocorallia sp. A-T 12471]
MQERTEEQSAYLAMELALRVGELMLAGGESAESVERAVAGFGRALGMPARTEVNVTLSAISVSYLPGHGRPPVTCERTIRRRVPDFTRVVAVDRLVAEAERDGLTIEEASERLRWIILRPGPYPWWVHAPTLAVLAGAGAVLVGGGPLSALGAFVATLLGDRAAARLGARGVSEFLQTAFAASLAATLAAVLVWLDVEVRAGAVIIGVVIALIPGRALVASMQDGIAGDYVTGSIRLIEALYIIAAILSGVGFTIYVAARIGVPISLEHLPLARLTANSSVLAAGVISAAFAVHVVVPPRWVLPGAVGGMVSWTLFTFLLRHDVAAAAATLLATLVVGLFMTALARYRGVSPIVAVVPCVAPLMPGSLMYRGLLEVTTGHTETGLVTLVEAVSTALALGAGVILGGELLRAIRPVRVTAAQILSPVARRSRRERR